MKADDNVYPEQAISGSGGDYYTTGVSGLTVRDHAALVAMQGYITSIGVVGGPAPTEQDIARYSYEMADAMIEESQK